ncbi:MAG: GGDEF domain-containing protein [Candidatus Saelkia tenebricola]|nr:GGDEF domain-containing protein [Candidatus Saelkia tenebricola]
MSEILFLLTLVVLLVFVKNIKYRIVSSGVLFLLVLFFQHLNLNIFFAWMLVYVGIFVLDYINQNLVSSEIKNIKLRHENAKEYCSKSEVKLVEIEQFNKQVQKEVTKITGFFEISKELTKVMYLQQLTPVIAEIVKGGFDVASLGVLIFDKNKMHNILIYPDKNIIDFKENIEVSPSIDRDNIISDEESGFYNAEGLEPLLVKLGYVALREEMYIIPLILEGRINGFMMLEDLSEDKIDLAHTFAGFLALTLRKIKLYDKVQELAITDELTQVFVRRHFRDVYHGELSRAKDRNDEACFLMLDLDKFKSCNDTFGHLVGDVILKETAKIIKQSVREIDIVGRYGGEEFCVFLTETKLKDGIYVAERIRKTVERYTFRAYDETLKITVSIGLSLFPYDARDSIELIEKADLALYYAKRKGRNKVIAYSVIK